MRRCLTVLLLLLCVLMSSMSRHARGSDSGQDADTVSRLHKLELMLSQQQQEFKLERMEWKTTTKALKENIETLRKAVATFKTEKEELRKDIEFLRLAQSALVEENRNLKDDVKVLHEKVEFMMHEHGTFEDDVHPLNETVKGVDKLSGKSYDGHQQVQSQTLKKSEELGTRTSQSRSHKVSLRSDDPGPSAAVIGQMKQQLTQVIAEVQMLKYDIEQQDNDIQESRGSTFVRWGSSTCPPSSQVVYSGVLGGSDTASLTGSAPNHLCLSNSPVFTKSQNADGYHALVYGGEYETQDVHNNRDPVCAVCISPRPTSIMVPGTNACPTEWNLEYAGYLMASRSNHPAGSEFVCVDPQMEARPGSDANIPANELWYSATVCGSLPCPPYENGKVVLCAVCTK